MTKGIQNKRMYRSSYSKSGLSINNQRTKSLSYSNRYFNIIKLFVSKLKKVATK